MTTWRVPVGLHIGGIAVVIALVTPVAARDFLSGPAPNAAGTSQVKARRTGLDGWREPRTVVIALVALAFTMAEGAGSNWISLTLIDHHHTTAAVATLAYAAVTLGRWLGPVIVDRLGRPGALRAAAAATAAGVALFALGPNAGTALARVALWGTGASLGFPLTLSAGADELVRAVGRVGVITSVGYCGFVSGPPLIGFVAAHTGLSPALLVVAVLVAGAVPLAGAARPDPPVSRARATATTPSRRALTHQGEPSCPAIRP